MAGKNSDASLPGDASELWEMVVTYAKQETIQPITSLGRFLAFGVAGSVLLSIGLVLFALAGLRALQTETGDTFDENLSWLPYLIVLVGAAVVAGLARRAIGAAKRNVQRR